MALSWTMDKLGPICRSVEDCAIVLDAIYGPDGQDNTVIDAPYHWNAKLSPKHLRIGYVKSAFDLPLTDPTDAKKTLHATKKFDDAALDIFSKLGINLIPVDLPDVPYDAMRIILSAEAAASFDELTRSDRDKELVQQGKFDWPNSFRTSRFIPAVDYVNANRLRSIAIQKWDDLMKTVFRDDGTPVSLTFLGGLFEEAKVLAVARAYQDATGFHLKHPVVPLTPPTPAPATG
jgi:Asp-tRNA(Asn)/Glu-tRNA(Gln) amidotransferase A subunit family amidase